jgi:hypothetical protein
MLMPGNSTYAAIAAVVVTNIILFLYVIVAYLEGDDEAPIEPKTSKIRVKKTQ